MPLDRDSYRFISDAEPKEEDLEKLMHEVAVEAVKKSTLAKAELKKRLHHQISEALVREGFVPK